MKRQFLRVTIKDESRRTRACVYHTIKRFSERLDLVLDEMGIIELGVSILEGDFEIVRRVCTNKIFVKVTIGEKKAFVLFNEALLVPQTVYTKKMYHRWYQ